jgi:hypothetical protein
MYGRRLWWAPAFFAWRLDIYKNSFILFYITTVKQLREFLATLPDDLPVNVGVAKRGRGYSSDYTEMVPLSLDSTTGNIMVWDNVLDLGEA